MEKDWVMVRLPDVVHKDLVAFARQLAKRTKGKIRAKVRFVAGECLVSLEAAVPLWHAVRELLRRDAAHKQRGKKRKGD